jgi:transcription elongation factor Elf1
MKTFNCSRCGKYIGEMEKGRILKESKIYCSECGTYVELIISLHALDTKTKSYKDSENDLFTNLFGKLKI